MTIDTITAGESAAPPPAPQPPARPAQGPPTRYLADLKVMGAVSTRYPREGSSNKQVDRRGPGAYQQITRRSCKPVTGSTSTLQWV